MKSEIEKKLKLSRQEKQDLKLYFFVIHPRMKILTEIAVLPVLGFSLEDVLIKARIDVKNIPLTFTGQSVLVKDFVNSLYLGDTHIPTTKEVKSVKSIPKKILAKEEFKASLLLTLNESKKWDMKLSGKDKTMLKKIFEKL